MGIPLFLLFAVYGVVNTYLPLLLFNLGYSPTMIGILQGVFEASGLTIPILVSSRVDKKGTYAQVMIVLGLLMAVVLPPLVYFRNFWVTAAMLALFAIGFKGAVPVADALVSRRLGATNNTQYGKIRVLGSIGFVCITLLLQFSALIDASSPVSIAFWIALPALLFSASVFVIPGLFQASPVQGASVSIPDVTEGSSPSLWLSIRQFPLSFWIGIGLIFLGYVGMTPSQRFFSLYVQEYLHLDSYAGLWALAAASEVPFMFLSGKFIRKYGTERIILVSLLAICLRNLVYAVFPSLGGAITGQLFHAICFGLFHPAAVVFVTQRAPKRLVAVALTLYSSVSVGIASVIGNVIGGLVIDGAGYRMLFISFSFVPLVGIILFYRFHQVLIQRD